MTASQPNLFFREDTVFGVCEGIGEDFGFNAQYLRVALAGLIFFNPLVAIGAYAALGIAVFSSRMLFPKPAAAAVEQPASAPAAENDPSALELPLAA